MSPAQELVQRLTSPDLPVQEQRRSLQRFAREMGWRPSDRVDDPITKSFAQVHLVVEHGLENTAVISFLSKSFIRLSIEERKALLSLSYNNLVDWHISVDEVFATFLYNRTDPPKVVDRVDVFTESADALRGEMFEQMVGRRPTPNLPALDTALIQTISHWKRLLVSELAHRNITNVDLSALFNAIIFARAVEDHSKRAGRVRGTDYLLQALWNQPESSFRDAVQLVLQELLGEDPPHLLFDIDSLEVFDELGVSTIEGLFKDFYYNRYSRFYSYDFAIMSKHALSRIYEHYVSLLHFRDTAQATLFPAVPDEEMKRASGSVYTPEFIARFFARILREHLPPNRFRQLRTIDPACGSGIFLRTLVENQCDPFTEFPADITAQIERTIGIDVDENAAQAARLSMALLHLVLTSGRLPESLPIHSADAFSWLENTPEAVEGFDAVLANPPFVAIENQPAVVRDRIRNFLGALGHGRIDSYQAFLLLGLQLLRPGGYGLFVVPHSFLISDSASPLREHISENAHIRFLVDLSGVQVFEDVDAYVVLVVFQKAAPFVEAYPATVVRVKELIGSALQDALEGQQVETPYYSVDSVHQDVFGHGAWIIPSASEASLKNRLEEGVPLSKLFEVRQGFVSGSDDVFVIDAGNVPEGEEALFAPLLRDRDMETYGVPSKSSFMFFYPYVDGELVDESTLRSRFPGTYSYLTEHRDVLEARSAVVKGNLAWWRPERPRPPQRMLVPKIVTPHLVIVPRFGLDVAGTYAISRSPMIMSGSPSQPKIDLLRYVLGVLNSTPGFWYVTHVSHKYNNGYSMLEAKTLKSVPIPNPGELEASVLSSFVELVAERITHPSSYREIEYKIDKMVASFYKLSSRDQTFLGIA